MSFGELSSASTHIYKAGKTHDKMHKILLPKNATHKEGPQIRGNRRATQDAPEDKAQGPPVSLPEEEEPKNLHLGVSRPPGLSEPGLIPVKVQLDVE